MNGQVDFDALGRDDAHFASESEWLMIKLVYCFARKADLAFQEFVRYWRDVHGPIGAAPRIPGVRRLVQSVGIHDPRDRYTSSFDGMAELWFDDVEAVLRARARAQSGKPPPQTKSISSITAERRTF